MQRLRNNRGDLDVGTACLEARSARCHAVRIEGDIGERKTAGSIGLYRAAVAAHGILQHYTGARDHGAGGISYRAVDDTGCALRMRGVSRENQRETEPQS